MVVTTGAGQEKQRSATSIPESSYCLHNSFSLGEMNWKERGDVASKKQPLCHLPRAHKSPLFAPTTSLLFPASYGNISEAVGAHMLLVL